MTALVKWEVRSMTIMMVSNGEHTEHYPLNSSCHSSFMRRMWGTLNEWNSRYGCICLSCSMVASQPPWWWYLFSKRLEASMSVNVIILVNHNDSEGGGYNVIMSLILPWSCRVRCLSRKICTQKLRVAIPVPANSKFCRFNWSLAGWACADCLFLKFELINECKGFSPTITIDVVRLAQATNKYHDLSYSIPHSDTMIPPPMWTSEANGSLTSSDCRVIPTFSNSEWIERNISGNPQN